MTYDEFLDVLKRAGFEPHIIEESAIHVRHVRWWHPWAEEHMGRMYIQGASGFRTGGKWQSMSASEMQTVAARIERDADQVRKSKSYRFLFQYRMSKSGWWFTVSKHKSMNAAESASIKNSKRVPVGAMTRIFLRPC